MHNHCIIIEKSCYVASLQYFDEIINKAMIKTLANLFDYWLETAYEFRRLLKNMLISYHTASFRLYPVD